MVACTDPATAPKPTAVPVEFIAVKAAEIPIYKEYIGEVFGQKDISIRARVEGFLEGIHFQEGGQVQEGQLLYTIDPQTLEADEAAKASQLAAAKSDLANARADLGRIEPLVAIKAVSQSEYDAAKTKVAVAEAQVRAAQAGLKSSSIQLGYTEVLAPLTGVIGQTKAKVGEFVGRDPNPVILNVISRIDTIRVEFFISEQEYLLLRRKREAMRLDTTKAKSIPPKLGLELILSDGSVHTEKGYVDFLDRQVDPATGSLKIQASFANPTKLIRPGQFVRVRGLVEVVPNGIMIPQRAVQEIQGKYRIWLIDSAGTAEPRFVEASSTFGNMWVIDAGLQPGEKVIVSGQQRLGKGVPVEAKSVEMEVVQPQNAR
jgi:membrane fusion protein (multidrug efflux system)